MQPQIDVVIASKNPISFYGEEIVEKALKSIDEQTYQNWRILLCCYGGDTESNNLGKFLKDPGKLLILRAKRQTFTQALNSGIRSSVEKIIARQDLDDWSHPQRFEKQIKFLLKNPEVKLLGTMAYEYRDGEIIDFERPKPIFKHSAIISKMAVCNPFVHGSVMFRREAIKEVGFYDETYEKVQDFDLWCRVALKYQVANLRDRLYYWRNNPNSATMKTWPKSSKIRDEIYNKWEDELRKARG